MPLSPLCCCPIPSDWLCWPSSNILTQRIESIKRNQHLCPYAQKTTFSEANGESDIVIFFFFVLRRKLLTFSAFARNRVLHRRIAQGLSVELKHLSRTVNGEYSSASSSSSAASLNCDAHQDAGFENERELLPLALREDRPPAPELLDPLSRLKLREDTALIVETKNIFCKGSAGGVCVAECVVGGVEEREQTPKGALSFCKNDAGSR